MLKLRSKFSCLLLILASIGCSEPKTYQEPRVRELLPINVDVRIDNYADGSCMHASMSTLLHYLERDQSAKWWRNTYRGGELPLELVYKAENLGFEVEYTYSADQKFLEWVSKTRRTAVITYKPYHAVLFVEFVDWNGEKYAKILDNNNTRHYEYVPKAEFLQLWRYFGGFALSLNVPPPAPDLWRRHANAIRLSDFNISRQRSVG